MLAELRYAGQLSQGELSGLFSDRALFEMATAVPARIAGIGDKVGSLRPGLFADLFVLMGDSSHPYAALTHAKPEDVHLVLVGGIPIYGSEKLMGAFAIKTEPLDVCGKKMVLNSPALTAGAFADVTGRLKADLSSYHLELGPLEECPNAVP